MNTIFNFKKMNNEYGKAILNWHYEDEYKFYDMDFDKKDLKEFVDQINNNIWTNKYAVLDQNEDLIGFFSYYFNNDLMEIGLGLKPNFTGKGVGKQFVIEGIKFGRLEFNYTKRLVKLSVASFNKRAIKVYKKIGFYETTRYTCIISENEYEFINMILEIF